ncbi:hypothetical protein E4T56_gene1438 [Termitomyces sp. T112]|nr:hypothetical protein E4T56_gene1438 [Termitomyces sp. T112]
MVLGSKGAHHFGAHHEGTLKLTIPPETRAQAKRRLENLIESPQSFLLTPQHSLPALCPRPLADEFETARNLCDVSEILADFLGAFIKSFLDTPLSPLTPTDSLFFPEAQSIPSPPTNPLPLLNPTIALMNNDPVTQQARMLPCNNTTVPKWDESHPRELPQYFKELEYLFADCGIADDTQKKEYAARYVSYDTAETWLGLPEFGDNVTIGNNAPFPHVAYRPVNNAPKVTPTTSDPPATSSPTDSTPAPVAKPADKGKAPKHTVVKEQPPVAKEPVAQPPAHPFSGIPSCYAPPANRNFTAPNRTNNGAYQTMPPIYDIEQSKAVFEQVLSIRVTVLVGKLCSVSQDIRNQFRTAVMPKQLVGASANTVQDPSDIFKDILPTFAIEEPQFSLGSNTDTTNGLTSDKAPFTSVDPVEAYIDSLPHGEEPVVLTVAKDSQSLRTIMMLIDNKEEVECIHDSGSQIISMFAEIASDIGLSYDPNIVLNMQSANGTMD